MDLKKLISLLMLSSASWAVHADLLPPGLEILKEQIRANPKFYNMADQFCLGKELGDRCTVLGLPFDGGGQGTCERVLKPWQTEAIAECTVSTPPKVERRLSSNRFQLNEMACQLTQGSSEYKRKMEALNASCEVAPVATDQFCTGKKEGDTCQAEFTVGTKKLSATGVCKIEVESERISYGESMKQHQLKCQPAKNVVRNYVQATPPSSRSWLRIW